MGFRSFDTQAFYQACNVTSLDRVTLIKLAYAIGSTPTRGTAETRCGVSDPVDLAKSSQSFAVSLVRDHFRVRELTDHERDRRREITMPSVCGSGRMIFVPVGVARCRRRRSLAEQSDREGSHTRRSRVPFSIARKQLRFRSTGSDGALDSRPSRGRGARRSTTDPRATRSGRTTSRADRSLRTRSAGTVASTSIRSTGGTRRSCTCPRRANRSRASTSSLASRGSIAPTHLTFPSGRRRWSGDSRTAGSISAAPRNADSASIHSALYSRAATSGPAAMASIVS